MILLKNQTNIKNKGLPMERAILVTVDLYKPRSSEEAWSAQERSDELVELATSAGAKVVAAIVVKRDSPKPSHFIGEGKVEEIAALCAGEKARLVIFNNDLTGTQAQNLTESIGARAIDRTQLILDIFASRAHSGEGKLQVELAQLMYLMPRLSGKGTELSRLGGGIGTRGPGEQKLEMDRRRIRDRIVLLKKELNVITSRRTMMRKKRDRFQLPSVAIVGYTNAGKSTLLNTLTGSSVFVGDKLFATLDPTVRRFSMPACPDVDSLQSGRPACLDGDSLQSGRPDRKEILFIDTVGFLNDLPHHVIEAFKATLEEAVEADLLIHLVDASHRKAVEQAEAARGVLKQIGAGDKPVIIALNKADKADPGALERLKGLFKDAVVISALKKTGLDELIAAVSTRLPGN